VFPDHPSDVNLIQVPSEHFKDEGSDVKYIDQESDFDEVESWFDEIN